MTEITNFFDAVASVTHVAHRLSAKSEAFYQIHNDGLAEEFARMAEEIYHAVESLNRAYSKQNADHLKDSEKITYAALAAAVCQVIPRE